jgi:hypothetical protein
LELESGYHRHTREEIFVETDDVKGAHCYEVCYGVDRVGQVGQSGILMIGRKVVVGCFGSW